MKEIWVDIKEYEGLYKVSNLGNVQSFPKQGNGNKYKILTPYIVGKDRNYLAVRLYKNKINKQYKIHRLVAEAFIPNIDNKPQVNHIDGNTLNNTVENLEWCTNSENQIHAFKTGLRKHFEKSIEIIKSVQFLAFTKCSKPVIQFDNNYNLINLFGGISIASRETGINDHSINKNVKLMTTHGGNYKWRWVKDCILPNKIIVISGKMASGKNYILNELKNKYKLNELISHTTRPPRLNEVDKETYFFTDDESFKKKAKNLEFLEIRSFDTEYGVWLYGLGCNELLKNNGICILDLEGLKELKKKIGKHNIISVYIDCDMDIRKSRAINRDIMDSNKILEIERRLTKDEEDFKEKEIKNEYNYILSNNNIDDFNKNILLFYNIIKNTHTNYKQINPIETNHNEFLYNSKWYNTVKDLAKDYKIKYNLLRYRLNKNPNIEYCLDNSNWKTKNIKEKG